MMSVDELEAYELENGDLTAPMCSLLLVNYLLVDDLLNAKFLWKRSTDEVKADAEVAAVWNLGKKLWAKDFHAFYDASKQYQWSATMLPLINQLVDKVRRHAFALMGRVYTTVQVSHFASAIDAPVDETVRLATCPDNASDSLWRYIETTNMLEKLPGSVPTRSTSTDVAAAASQRTDQEHLQLLTDYVSFLEI